MKERRIGSTADEEATDWARLRALSDRQIGRGIDRDPDANRTTVEFWNNARVVMPRRKQAITIRLDADLLTWLREQKGYQTRVNAVLRTYMEATRSGVRRARK